MKPPFRDCSQIACLVGNGPPPYVDLDEPLPAAAAVPFEIARFLPVEVAANTTATPGRSIKYAPEKYHFPVPLSAGDLLGPDDLAEADRLRRGHLPGSVQRRILVIALFRHRRAWWAANVKGCELEAGPNVRDAMRIFDIVPREITHSPSIGGIER